MTHAVLLECLVTSLIDDDPLELSSWIYEEDKYFYQIIKWCRENCEGKFKVYRCTPINYVFSFYPEFKFELIEDAINFAMRWK